MSIYLFHWKFIEMLIVAINISGMNVNYFHFRWTGL